MFGWRRKTVIYLRCKTFVGPTGGVTSIISVFVGQVLP